MNPETPSERVALVVWYMAHNVALSTREVAKITRISKRGALELMNRISRVLPIYLDDRVWRICHDGEQDAQRYVIE